jgi:hypothetical protein
VQAGDAGQAFGPIGGVELEVVGNQARVMLLCSGFFTSQRLPYGSYPVTGFNPIADFQNVRIRSITRLSPGTDPVIPGTAPPPDYRTPDSTSHPGNYSAGVPSGTPGDNSLNSKVSGSSAGSGNKSTNGGAGNNQRDIQAPGLNDYFPGGMPSASNNSSPGGSQFFPPSGYPAPKLQQQPDTLPNLLPDFAPEPAPREIPDIKYPNGDPAFAAPNQVTLNNAPPNTSSNTPGRTPTSLGDSNVKPIPTGGGGKISTLQFDVPPAGGQTKKAPSVPTGLKTNQPDTNPLTAPDPNEEKLKKIQDDLLKLGIVIGGLNALMRNPITPAQVKEQVKTGVCELTQPGGCINNALEPIKKSADDAKDSTNGLRDLLAGLNTALSGLNLEAVTAGFADIKSLLGTQLPGGISGAMKKLFDNKLVDRVIAYATLATSMHNALMLSNNVLSTLFFL